MSWAIRRRVARNGGNRNLASWNVILTGIASVGGGDPGHGRDLGHGRGDGGVCLCRDRGRGHGRGGGRGRGGLGRPWLFESRNYFRRKTT